jgi:hypothetical protein
MIIERTGVGTVTHTFAIRDSHGTGLLPLQAEVVGSATFRILGKVRPEAPWVEIRAANTAAFLESISWVPYLQLSISAGTGTVRLYVGEK